MHSFFSATAILNIVNIAPANGTPVVLFQPPVGYSQELSQYLELKPAKPAIAEG